MRREHDAKPAVKDVTRHRQSSGQRSRQRQQESQRCLLSFTIGGTRRWAASGRLSGRVSGRQMCGNNGLNFQLG